MAASLHLARYSPRGAGRMMGAVNRFGPVFAGAPGLAAARLCFTAVLDPVTGGWPRLTRFGLFCGWESSEARDEFLGDPVNLRPFTRDARESWSVSLDTVRTVRGEWHGWTPSTEGVQPLRSDEPLAVLTYGVLSARHLPTFTWNNAKVVRELAGNPAETMRIGLGDHPLARATFSLWRSKGEMVRFSYGAGVHNPLQRRSLETPWGKDWFFARFRPVDSRGTWGGVDPLAEVRSAASRPDRDAVGA